ncbi:S9 family peptidase [Acidobacteriota bacterium]
MKLVMQTVCKGLFVILMMFASFSFTNAGQDILTPMDTFNLEFLVDPQISPDGTQILYTRNFMDVSTDMRCSNIWMINFDGTNHRPLTSGKYNDSSARWSPDGKQIIFVSNRDGKPQIYKRWMDTGQTVMLTNLQIPPSSISWSPDSKWISYVSFVPSMPRMIAKMPPPPPGSQWAQPARVYDRLVYRFDGVGYGYGTGYMHIFVLPAEGGTARQLSKGNFNHGSMGMLGLGGSVPVWTPDSKYLLASVNRRDDNELEPRDTEIYQFSVSDGTMKALSDRRGPDGGPAISPDGKYIAYLGFDDRYQGYQLTKLYIMNRDGSESKVLLKDFDRSVAGMIWSPDSKGLVFSYSTEGNTKLAYTTLDGKVKNLADDLGFLGIMCIGMGMYSIAPNGNIAYTVSTPDVMSDIAVTNLKNPQSRQVTAINDDVLGHKTIGQVEEIWYESSKDGRKIQGWIIKPPHFDPAKKYPLILEIHGGPFADYGDRFDLEKQVMAANGYVVLYTNPRGSTSYGEEFGNLIHHAYPGDDFYDLNSGVDAVIKKGYIDETNLFVTGGSGGGVLTCWMIGNTTRFTAAASLYPVINWTSWSLTSDIPITGVKYWFPGPPWDHPEQYAKRSLLSLVGNVKTPTMVICGDNDWRTPYWESEQYYRALKLQGVESVLVIVPNESHGILLRPSHWLTKLAHIIGWFDSHRK